MGVASQPVAQALTGDEDATTEVVKDLLPPRRHEETPVLEPVSGEAGQGRLEVLAEPITESDTQLATTSQTLSTTMSGPSLQTYSADLTRAKAVCSKVVKKSSKFDTIFKVVIIIS